MLKLSGNSRGEYLNATTQHIEWIGIHRLDPVQGASEGLTQMAALHNWRREPQKGEAQ